MSEVTFEPYQPVLVRDTENQAWSAAFFSHEQHSEDGLEYICGGVPWNHCIPYNDETKHLLGTTDSGSKHEPPEFKWGDHVEVADIETPLRWRKAIFLEECDTTWLVLLEGDKRPSNWYRCRHADW